MRRPPLRSFRGCSRHQTVRVGEGGGCCLGPMGAVSEECKLFRARLCPPSLGRSLHHEEPCESLWFRQGSQPQ